MTFAVRAENLSKCYRVRSAAASVMYRTLRSEMVQYAADLVGRLRGTRAADDSESFWALREVSFEILPGEVVGIVGRNGAGKSTLLKVLSRITRPTSGRARVRGRVGSLLEVGTGFHPELSGRENIYLSGAVMGMTRREIQSRFDEIVAFAEVEKFLDTTVKRYSSGMYMRLAFAVAAHLEPEILIVDEVLAVGDASFQKKCLGKMSDVAQAGRTVLLVSHNMAAVTSLCRRAIWLDAGQVVADGAAYEVTEAYLDQSLVQTVTRRSSAARRDDLVDLQHVVLKNAQGEPASRFAPGDSMTVEIHFDCARPLVEPRFFVAINSQHGPALAANMLLDGQQPSTVAGPSVLRCTFDSLPLLPQTYTVHIGARASDNVTPLMPSQDVMVFHVVGRLNDFGLSGASADEFAHACTPVVLPYSWQLPDGQTVSFHGLTKTE